MSDFTESPVVAVIPGNGWRVQHKDLDGSIIDEPILAWVFYADGTVHPVEVDGRGNCSDSTQADNLECVYHPDEAQRPQAPTARP